MLTSFRLLIGMGILGSCLGWSEQSWKDADRKEIEILWGEYNQAFIGKDYAKLREILQVPFLRISDRQTLMMNTMDEAIQSYHRSREQLDGRGYKTSRFNFADARISLLSANHLLLNIPYSRYKTDGKLLERGAGFYILTKSAGKWKINTVLSQDPTEMGKVH